MTDWRIAWWRLPIVRPFDLPDAGSFRRAAGKGLATAFVFLILIANACCQTAPSAELLVCGGFEHGDGGWDGSQPGVGIRWETVCGGEHSEIYCLDSAFKHSGFFSQRMTCEGFRYHWLEGGGYCYSVDGASEKKHPAPAELGMQAIAQTTAPGLIRPGRRYRASVWVRIEGLTETWEWFRLGIYWLDSAGGFLQETREPDTDRGNHGSHEWRQVVAEGDAPPGAAFAKVYLHHHFVHGTVWFDDASLTQLPAVQEKRAPH
jgi:hypothetical protein